MALPVSTANPTPGTLISKSLAKSVRDIPSLGQGSGPGINKSVGFYVRMTISFLN
jgi:hypothetical protein